MKIVRLEIEGFLSIGKADLSLTDRGLVLVQGENRDNPSAISNGAGKSSMIDALCWCLYGDTSRGLPSVGVINTKAKAALVRATLDDDGTILMVERSRTKSKGSLKVWIDKPVHTDLTLGTEKLTQERLVKQLGCSFEVFCAAVCIGQENMPDLPLMTDRNLKQVIEEAAGVGLIEAAYERARKDYAVAKARHGEEIAAVDRAGVELSASSRKLSDLKASQAAWGAERAIKAGALSDAFIRAVQDTKKAGEVLALHALLPLSNAEATLKAVSEELDAIAAQRKEEERLVTEASSRTRDIATLEATLRSLLASIKTSEAKAEVLQAEADKPCETCGGAVVPAALARALEAERASAQEARRNAQAKGALLVEARKASADADAALQAFRARMTDVADLEKRRAKAQEVINHHRQLQRDYDNAKADEQTAKRAIDELADQKDPYKDLIEAATDENNNASENMRNRILQMKEVEAEAERHQAVVNVFGPAGVRAHILDEVTPYLNDRTAAYLAVLSDETIQATWSTLVPDAKGVLKEKFAIEVVSTIGQGFLSLSGGERRKVRIACALALQDLVASRATKPFKLWVADEIDDALDAAGLERLMTVLHDKAAEKGTVLVISHNDLKSWVDNVWTVTKENGVSRVTD